jgi:hypothetical protein
MRISMAAKTSLVVLAPLVALAAAQLATSGSTPDVDPGGASLSSQLPSSSVAGFQATPACDPQISDMACEAPPSVSFAINAPGQVCPSSPFTPPEANDSNFVTDCASGLDTGCTFRNGGPLIFSIKIGRVIGNKAKLRAAGLLGDTVTLQLPAFDVDFFGGGGTFNPERDRVSFNGNVVPGEFLHGDNNIWELNEFDIPIDWVNFPSEDVGGGSPTPADNIVRIDIDTANTDLVWCTSIDWAAIHIDAPRPVVFVHGILSSHEAWIKSNFNWVDKLDSLGIPNANPLDMGNLDSIQNNSAKIAMAVEQAKQRFGVEKVNLVCHSKGGLDSRNFVENNDSVERVIQLGTPNAGSPLADVAQGILVGTIGLPATLILNVLATPAGYQLTTVYMALYNASHGHNPNVKYTALAGDYDPDCSGLRFFNPLCQLDNLLLLIAGRGDTIVPITSVFALPYTEDRQFPSSRTNGDAKHTNLNDSSGVYNMVKDRVEGPAASLLTQGTVPTTARTAALVGTIQQGEVVVRTLPIDQTTPASFSLMYASGDLDLALISPSGVRYDATTVAGNPDIAHLEGEAMGGIIEGFHFAAPEAGIWTAEVSAPSVTDPSGTVAFAVIAWVEDPVVTLAAEVAQPNVRAGQPLRLLGTLRSGGAPLTGATVSARVALPDNTAVDLQLHDDGTGGDAAVGDGVYTADFGNTSQGGNYRIVFQASSGSPAFSREAYTAATVSRSNSAITGPFTDAGVDTDGDGLFNLLRVQVPVSITAAGNYRLVGQLTDSAGNNVTVGVSRLLAASATTLALDFDGQSLFRNGVDGPYDISLRLVEESELEILPVDERTDAHRTAAYSFRAFQHAALGLNGDGAAQGVDLNGNGQFDLLNVSVGVEVLRAGFYQWSGRLTDRNGKQLGFGSSAGLFAPGANALTFTFDGRAIGDNGVDGPYFVRGLLVFGAGASLVASNAFTTEAFSASQFEGFDNTPPSLQVSLSPSTLWPPNHKMIPIAATIAVSDDRDPNPQVELVSITSNEPVNGAGDGNTDADIQGAEVGSDDRKFALRAERSGNGPGRIYTVTYRARDAVGNQTTATATVTVPHDQ